MKAFLLGAAGYPVLELCWRGRTHPAMALAGGICCWGLDRLRRSKPPWWAVPLLSGGMITAVEAAAGLLWNRQHQIWDYRGIPGNWRGQVCIPYALLWSILGTAAVSFLNASDHPQNC